MVGHIPENVLEDILSRVDVVEVISGCIPLKRAGRNFRALCPFHQEKSPSFMVSPDRQIYHCFGCGESGNAFKFLMRFEHMDFPEAVEQLAKKTGVLLPEAHKQDPKTACESTQMYQVNELAVSFFEQNLHSAHGAHARTYLADRKITEATCKTFKIGYALDKWDALLNYARGKKIGIAQLEKAGLTISRESGGFYDRFRRRIIFPIVDIKSRCIGFGGRVFSSEEKDTAKYVNSPETPVYVKGKNLYGLAFAKDAIREKDYAVVVEGYLDFMMPYQEGLHNIVASLGTALTPDQARLLKRYTQHVVMVYDADNAGQMATVRSLDIFVEEGMDVRVVSLPQGFDPDLFVRTKGIESLYAAIEEAQGLFDYKLKMLKARYDIRTIEDKAMIASEMLVTINKFKNAIVKSEYLKKLSEALNISEDALMQEVKKTRNEKSYSPAPVVAGHTASPISSAEKLLIMLMIEENELIHHVRKSVEPSDFQDGRLSRIVALMFSLIEQGKTIETNTLVNYLSEQDEEVMKVFCESAFGPQICSGDKEKMANDCILRLKSEKIKLQRQHLHNQIKTAQHRGDEQRLQELIKEFDLLIKQR